MGFLYSVFRSLCLNSSSFLVVECSIFVTQMLTLGWDYPLVNLLEVEKKFFLKKKKSLSHIAQGASQISGSAPHRESAVSPGERHCSCAAQQDPAVRSPAWKVRMPKSEVPCLWGPYCFHACIKPESVSDRYLKTILETRGNFSCSHSRDNFSTGWYVFLISCILQVSKFFFRK